MNQKTPTGSQPKVQGQGQQEYNPLQRNNNHQQQRPMNNQGRPQNNQNRPQNAQQKPFTPQNQGRYNNNTPKPNMQNIEVKQEIETVNNENVKKEQSQQGGSVNMSLQNPQTLALLAQLSQLTGGNPAVGNLISMLTKQGNNGAGNNAESNDDNTNGKTFSF